MSHYSIILFSTPIFIFLIITEFIYGLKRNKNNYRINDTCMSISLGVLSRFPQILNLGIASIVYSFIVNNFQLNANWTPNPLTWVIAFITYDFLYYWLHRACHRINILWAAHCVHHHGEEYNLATALRQTSTGFMLKWIFFIPSFIIGIPADMFFIVGALNLVYQFWVHTEHIGKLGPLEYLMVTPSNHRVHHAKNDEYIDSNYGGVFIIWDRFFGTFVDEDQNNKIIYGTKLQLRSWNPVWANLQVYYEIIKSLSKKSNVTDFFKILYKPPGWNFDKQSTINTKQKKENLEKYNPYISSTCKKYITLQFILTFIITTILALQIYDINKLEIIICMIFIISNLYTISFLSETKVINLKLEFIKSSLFLLLFYFSLHTYSLQVSYLLHLLTSFTLIFLYQRKIELKDT